MLILLYSFNLRMAAATTNPLVELINKYAIQSTTLTPFSPFPLLLCLPHPSYSSNAIPSSECKLDEVRENLEKTLPAIVPQDLSGKVVIVTGANVGKPTSPSHPSPSFLYSIFSSLLLFSLLPLSFLSVVHHVRLHVNLSQRPLTT